MFGLWNDCPENAKVAWGARAILNNGSIDILWDRQSARTPNKETAEAFNRVLNKEVLPVVRKRVKELCNSCEMSGSENKLFTLYHKHGITVYGNTNGSHGYLYLIGFVDHDIMDGAEVPPLGSIVGVTSQVIGYTTYMGRQLLCLSQGSGKSKIKEL
ncbi:MAG: type IV toxin-antitoxin system YeeU family antitoxin [Desulfobulbaceae bacterium]|nr:type IV toxin-antitoxin system YeeU family antitoxin [Desulfobulbaceae bacterium]